MIHMATSVRGFVCAVCLMGLASVTQVGISGAAEPRAGDWSGGAAIGFLGYTPDGTAFATECSRRLFSESSGFGGPSCAIGRDGRFISVRLVGTGEVLARPARIGYAIEDEPARGLGFLHADLHTSDTSFLIPIGVGLDYTLNQQVSLISTFLLNFTDVETGRRTDANMMPGLTFGVRF
jgi:hypothetical protein